MNSSVYRILALSARAECAAGHYQRLAQEAAKLREWEEVSAQAEVHGVAPLLYVHLKAAGAQIPPTVKRALQGLYLRHRRANQVRTCVLRDILTAYNAAGIPALVLKGAALSHLVYPESGLRPMSDLDILVPKSEARRAQSLLAGLGFDTHLPPNGALPDKHMAHAVLHIEGLSVIVEVHHNLFSKAAPVSMEMDNLTAAPLPFSLKPDGFTAHTLGYEDMLWHICLQLCLVNALFASPRLIWIADIVSFAERFAAEIDWERVKARYPLVLNTLSLLHFMTPLPETLLAQAPLKIGHAPQGIGEDFRGWPNSSLAAQREKGYRRILRDTFFPSEWWLRLRYGLGSTGSLFWCRWVRHPLHILGWVKHLLLGRLSHSVKFFN
jgi:hypothetical protein